MCGCPNTISLMATISQCQAGCIPELIGAADRRSNNALRLRHNQRRPRHACTQKSRISAVHSRQSRGTEIEPPAVQTEHLTHSAELPQRLWRPTSPGTNYLLQPWPSELNSRTLQLLMISYLQFMRCHLQICPETVPVGGSVRSQFMALSSSQSAGAQNSIMPHDMRRRCICSTEMSPPIATPAATAVTAVSGMQDCIYDGWQCAGAWHNDMRPFMGHACDRVDAPPDAPPVVICPGKRSLCSSLHINLASSPVWNVHHAILASTA